MAYTEGRDGRKHLSIIASSEHNALDDTVTQEVAHLSTKIRLLTKQFGTMGVGKASVVSARGKYIRDDESDSQEELEYLDREKYNLHAKAKGLIKNLGTRGKRIKVKTIIVILIQIGVEKDYNWRIKDDYKQKNGMQVSL